jgi:hypothetical protein
VRWFFSFAVLVAAAACVGQGNGQVSGEVHVLQCNNRESFNRPDPTNPSAGPYQMDPDFFVGEPIEDLHQDGFPMNRLDIREQKTSGNIGNAINSLDDGAGIDALWVSISDVRSVATMINQPIVLTPIIPTLPAPAPPPPVRVSLRLTGTCPLSPNNTLDASSDMTNPDPAMRFVSTITFTAFGNPGPVPPPDFKVDFGDHIHANFDLTLVDERFELGLTATAQSSGHVTGFFDFDLRRGASGQTFP